MRTMKTLPNPYAHNFPAFFHSGDISAQITPGKNPLRMKKAFKKETGRTGLTLWHNRDSLLPNFRDFTNSGV
jgi:hypothetical protein